MRPRVHPYPCRHAGPCMFARPQHQSGCTSAQPGACTERGSFCTQFARLVLACFLHHACTIQHACLHHAGAGSSKVCTQAGLPARKHARHRCCLPRYTSMLARLHVCTHAFRLDHAHSRMHAGFRQVARPALSRGHLCTQSCRRHFPCVSSTVRRAAFLCSSMHDFMLV